MKNIAPDIRNAVRAVIVRDNRILLIRKTGNEPDGRYALPGGAQDLGETLKTALDRECMEEIGSSVEIVALLHVADFFKDRDTNPPSTRHLVEFLFQCTVPDGYVAHNGDKPDKSQIGVVWVDLADLAELPLFPKSLTHWLPESLQPGAAVYLGTLE